MTGTVLSLLFCVPIVTSKVLNTEETYGLSSRQASDVEATSLRRAGAASTLSPPVSKPTDAAIPPKDFVGFGFETAFLNDYTVGTFSENLVNSIATRLSLPITIRIGGTSGDRVIFDPSLHQDKLCVSGDCPIGSAATYRLGPSYFEGFKRFENQRLSFQAPLGPRLNVSGSLDYVSRAYAAVGADRVAAIALGNEPDLYGRAGGVTYGADDYVRDAVQIEDAIVSNLSLTHNQTRIFEAPDLAAYGNFDLSSAFNAGLNKNGRVKFAAEHYYQISKSPSTFGPHTEQALLMNHSAIKSMFAKPYVPSLQFIEKNQPSVDYILSETGSALSGPPRYFQDAFGAALWVVDFNLYAASLGVKRVDATQRPAANHSFWVPDDSANRTVRRNSLNPGPQVRGPFFGLPLVAESIGKAPGAIVDISTGDETSAYAIYDADSSRISKIVILNLKYWSSADGTSRGSTNFTIHVGKGIASAAVQRLHADAGARAQGYDVGGSHGNITWAGESWSYSLDNGKGHYTGAARSERARVGSDSVVVDVPESEAVLVSLSWS